MPPNSADRPLAPLPSNFETARLALHRVAERIVAPARKPENEISLRATFGGFGTPEFEFGGLRRQVRVEGAALVYRRGEDESRIRLTSLADAAALVAELLPSGTALDDAPLEIDDASAVALGAWYALGHTVLERLRAEAAQGRARVRRCSGPSTSTSRSRPATRRPGGGRTTASRRATRTTASPTSTSARGATTSPASSGTRPASPGPSSATQSCSGPRTRQPQRSTSAERAGKHSIDRSRPRLSPRPFDRIGCARWVAS